MRTEERTVELGSGKLLFRSPREEDAPLLLAYLKATCGETRFLSRGAEEVCLTEEEEREFIRQQNASATERMILVFLDGAFVGSGSLSGHSLRRARHRASLGIALYQRYTGLGIGRALMERLLEEAAEMGLEQVELEVSAENRRAIALYEKLGFTVFGRLPRQMRYEDGTYSDAYWMMKRL